MVCPHGRPTHKCRACGGCYYCPHDKQRQNCVECKGCATCRHRVRAYYCKQCPGNGICVHMNRKAYCCLCDPSKIKTNSKKYKLLLKQLKNTLQSITPDEKNTETQETENKKIATWFFVLNFFFYFFSSVFIRWQLQKNSILLAFGKELLIN